eukprot:PhF_6_TR6174/c0_g1_i3/m.9235
MLTDVPRLYAHSTFSSPAILNSGYFMSYLRGLTSEECFHHKLAEWVSTYIPPQPSPMIPAVPSPPPPPLLPDSPSEKESASNTFADAVTNSIHYPGQHPRSETAASEEDIDPLLVYCNPILPKVQKMLQADIEDQYRLFQYVNHSLHNPTQFMSLCPAPINPETKQTMVAMYYDLDPTVSRHFFWQIWECSGCGGRCGDHTMSCEVGATSIRKRTPRDACSCATTDVDDIFF